MAENDDDDVRPEVPAIIPMYPTVLPYAVGCAESTPIAVSSLVNITRDLINNAGAAPFASVYAALDAYSGTVGATGVGGVACGEARWCARALAEALTALLPEFDTSFDNEDQAIAPFFGLIAGSAAGWAVVGADPAEPQTLAAAAQFVAQGARAFWHGGCTQTELEYADAVVAAWSMIATDVEPPSKNSLSDADLVRHARYLATHLMSVARDAARERAKPEPDAEQHGLEDGIVVIARVGGVDAGKSTRSGSGISELYRKLVGERFPRVETPDLSMVRAAMLAEFPWCERPIDLMLSDLVGRDYVWLRPSVLVSEPGFGKSRFCRKLASRLGVPLTRFDASAAGDSAFGGTPRRWSTGEPCVPLLAIEAHHVANPIVMVDELDKGSESNFNGRLVFSMLPLLERETAARYPDPYIQSEIDLSHVVYMATVNDDTRVPAVLRDRMRVIRLPRPGPEHVPVIVRTLIADAAADRGLDARWAEPLDGDELELVLRLWRGGSVRRLREVVERILARREQQAARH